jgi:AAA+ superfamily predicted ATPase
MANPLRDFFFGQIQPKRAELVEAIEPHRTFDDVILPQSTRIALDHALTQIKKHDLIFHEWGLGERHATGRGLAFNFAGPPGTGKTICAEAIATSLGKKLLVVRYSEVESLWAGETGKNVSAVFRSAESQDAVLFFDEADAIASRRFASVTQGFQREANTVVNVLLKELEAFDGVIIFATNLAANFDPAFERRIRTHILFAMPGPAERAKIWKVQLHARKTPLAEDVDFDALAEKYAVAGGDIKNAVLKAAQMATGEPGADAQKKIHQRHFIAGMEDVIAAKKVMEQTLFEDGDGSHSSAALAGMAGEWSRLSRNHEALENELSTLLERVGENERHVAALPGIIERFDDASRAAQNALRAEVNERIEHLAKQHESTLAAIEGVKSQIKESNEQNTMFRRQFDELATEIGAQKDASENLLSQQGKAIADLSATFEWRFIGMLALCLTVLILVLLARYGH